MNCVLRQVSIYSSWSRWRVFTSSPVLKHSYSIHQSIGEQKSQRQQLRETRLDLGLLQYLDKLNVGYIAKRKARVNVAHRIKPNQRKRDQKSSKIVLSKKQSAPQSSASEGTSTAPYPFGQRGKTAMRIDDPYAAALPVFDGNPPEVAIIGRSNVGKSTLLNALIRYNDSFVQKATVSNKPGETTSLSFYTLGKKSLSDHSSRPNHAPALVLVDMPGYGFAFMNEENRSRMNALCTNYLISNVISKRFNTNLNEVPEGLLRTATERGPVLKRVILLLDARHGIKLADIMFLKHLEELLMKSTASSSEAPLWKLQVVMTKCDLVERNELCRRITLVHDTLFQKLPQLYRSLLPIVPVAVVQNRGVRELEKELASLVPTPSHAT